MNVSDRPNLPATAPSPRIEAGAWVILACVYALGCGGPAPDEGRFDVSEIRVDDHRGQCLENAFPLDPSFYAARERIDSVGIFLQSEVDLGQDADVVYFEIFQPDRLRDTSETPVAFGGPLETTTTVRAEIELGETCPRLNASFRVQGQLRFSSLSTESGDRVAGELLEGAVIDNRSGETVAESANGRWDFAVGAGAGSEAYPTHDDEYRVDP